MWNSASFGTRRATVGKARTPETNAMYKTKPTLTTSGMSSSHFASKAADIQAATARVMLARMKTSAAKASTQSSRN